MVQQHVALVQGIEQCGVWIEGGRGLWRPGFRQQRLEAGHARPSHVGGEIERAILRIDRLAGGAGEFAHEFQQGRGESGRHLQAHGVAFLSRFDHVLHFLGEVEHLVVLDGNVAVARDAEDAARLHVLAGEEHAQKMRDHVLQGKAGPAFVRDFGQGDKSWEIVRQGDEGMARRRSRRRDRAGDDEPQAGQGRWSGIVGIHGHGREHGQHGFREVILDVAELRGRQLADPQLAHALFPQSREQLPAEQCGLLGNEALHLLADAAQLLRDGQAGGIGATRTGPRQRLQAADADHEELIEIGRRDGKEFQALEQWQVGTFRFREHAAVEFDPAEFPVEKRSGGGHEKLE